MFTPEQIARFSELDYIIYNYVTRHANEAVYMRIRELAEAVHVSPPTILRFCKKGGLRQLFRVPNETKTILAAKRALLYHERPRYAG
jgi:DNA-binding MurR/RpiR family transcriptional regulator